MPRLLRVSLTLGQCRYEPLPEHAAGLGGRGLAAALVAAGTPPSADPLGPDNILVFAPGLLAGTRCAGMDRMSVGFKSPLSALFHETNAGGMAAPHLARLDIAALVIEGAVAAKDNRLFQMEITPDFARLIPATVRGLGNGDAAKALAERHGERCSCIITGPAGEMGLTAASIAFTDRRQRPTRHAGRGGGGAVMGAKGLKAIVITAPETDTVPMHDAAAFSLATRRFAAALAAHRDAAPGRDGAGNCAVCVVGCPVLSPKKGKSGKWPGYELHWHANGRKADEDAALVARFASLCDDAGVDAFETALGLTLLQRAGKLAHGDARAALDLVERIGRGTAMGKLLGSGARAVARAYGLEMEGGSPLFPDWAQTPEENAEDEAAIDTLGICRFAARTLRGNTQARSALAAMLEARHGTPVSEEWLESLGTRVTALEKAFNDKAAERI